MKAKLEFDLDDPSDRKAHKRCVDATNAYIAIQAIDDHLRKITKYGYKIEEGAEWDMEDGSVYKITEKDSEILYNHTSKIRSMVHSYLEQLGVDLNDLD